MTLRAGLAIALWLLLAAAGATTGLAAPGRAACEAILWAAAESPFPADLAPGAAPGVAEAVYVPGVDVFGRPVAPAGAVLPDPPARPPAR